MHYFSCCMYISVKGANVKFIDNFKIYYESKHMNKLLSF